MVYPDMRWVAAAKCKDSDPKIFFPSRGEPSEEAKRLCGSCPVLDPCREHALRNDEAWGVWGGTGERERQAYRAKKLRREATRRLP